MGNNINKSFRRFRFRYAIAIIFVLLSSKVLSNAPLTYFDNGKERVQRLFQGILARCEAAYSPEYILRGGLDSETEISPSQRTPSSYIKVITNDLGYGNVTIRQAWFNPPLTTNDWSAPGQVNAAFIQQLDDMLLNITPKFVDTSFMVDNSYDNWFKKTQDTLIGGFLKDEYDRDTCTIDDNWRSVYADYDPETDTYDNFIGFYRLKTLNGQPLPASTTESNGYYHVESPVDYPFLCPAAVATKAQIGYVYNKKYNEYGQIISGEFSWTKDWRTSRDGENTTWTLWELTSDVAQYYWKGHPYNVNGHFGEGLLIPFYVDEYRQEWLTQRLGSSNGWTQDANRKKNTMFDSGPYYISYPKRDIEIDANDQTEVYCIVGKKKIGNEFFWSKVVSFYNAEKSEHNQQPASHTFLLTPINPSEQKPSNETEITHTMYTNKYMSATSLVGAGSEINSFWCEYDSEGDMFVNNDYGPNYGIIPQTNNYWIQWRGSSIPARYITTNTLPRYKTVRGKPFTGNLPLLAGVGYDPPAYIDPILGQVAAPISEQAVCDGESIYHWRMVNDSKAWLFTPPGTNTISLLYDPAQTLYTERLDEGLNRMTEMVLYEREEYLKQLKISTAPLQNWTWLNSTIWSNKLAATGLNIITNLHGTNFGTTLSERWASSQARATDLKTRCPDILDGIIEGVKGLPKETVAQIWDNAHFIPSAENHSPVSTMYLDHDIETSYDWKTTFWSLEYDPDETGFDDYYHDRIWTGYSHLELSSARNELFISELDLTFLIDISIRPIFRWYYYATIYLTGYSWHDFRIEKSYQTVTNFPVVGDLEFELDETQKYGNTKFTIDGNPWIFNSIAKTDEPITPAFPECIVNFADISKPPAVEQKNQYQIEQTATAFLLVTNIFGAESMQFVQNVLMGGWYPVITNTEYVVTYANTNKDWEATIKIDPDETFQEGGEPRPYIVMCFDVSDPVPVLLSAETNSTAKAQLLGVSTLNWPDYYMGDSNMYDRVSRTGNSLKYQTCDNVPHGSTIINGQDGAINYKHGVKKNFEIIVDTYVVNYTNMIYCETISPTPNSSWDYSVFVMDGPNGKTTFSPSTYNKEFTVNDWNGDYVTWNRFGTGKQTNFVSMWQRAVTSTNKTLNVDIKSKWLPLDPLMMWNFFGTE